MCFLLNWLGDRFWYENGNQTNSLTESQLREIRRVTLSRIICDNLDDIETVQQWIMLVPDEERFEFTFSTSAVVG